MLSIFREEKVIIRLSFELKSGFKAILPCFEQVNLTRARDPIGKPAISQQSTSKNI